MGLNLIGFWLRFKGRNDGVAQNLNIDTAFLEKGKVAAAFELFLDLLPGQAGQDDKPGAGVDVLHNGYQLVPVQLGQLVVQKDHIEGLFAAE